MNIKKLYIIVVLTTLTAMAGCSTTDIAADSHGRPIMSAEDVRAMIHVEVRAIEPSPAEQELVAATD